MQIFVQYRNTGTHKAMKCKQGSINDDVSIWQRYGETDWIYITFLQNVGI